MITKTSDKKRHEQNEIILRSGAFAYRYLPCWAQVPQAAQKSEITAVACDSADDVYVLTRHPEMPILVFTPSGEFLRSLGKGLFPARPHGIFINAQDELYCTDDAAHTAVKMTRDGKILASFGEAGKASDTGCDREAFDKWRAQENIPASRSFDRYLPLQMQLDTIIRTAGPFNGPTRMIETRSGDLYCSDGYGNAAVHRFSADGGYVSTFGRPGRAPGEMRLPHGILEDRLGRLWVADRENDRLQIFDTEGNLLVLIDGLFRPTELCTDGEHIYLSESDAGFSIFTQEAEIVAQFGFYHSPMYFHGIGINSQKDLFATTLGKNIFNNIVKLERVE